MTTQTGYSHEVFHRIYGDSEGRYIQVGPDADSLGLVEINTATTKDNAEYWGDCRVTVQPAMARLIGYALLKAADEVESK